MGWLTVAFWSKTDLPYFLVIRVDLGVGPSHLFCTLVIMCMFKIAITNAFNIETIETMNQAPLAKM